MLNQAIFVGRLDRTPEVHGDKGVITLRVPRPYKNSEGIYEDDLIPITIKGGILEHSIDFLTPNCVIGIKGRIENEAGRIKILAEKMTFLGEPNNNEEED